MAINIRDIKAAIRSLEISGKMVCIHSSLKSFGEHISGGAEAIIDAFLEEGCTILVFSYTDEFEICPPKDWRPKRNGIYDYRYLEEKPLESVKIFTTDNNTISKATLGMIPYTIVHMPNRKRGYHPLNPFTSVGKYAEELVKNQSFQEVWAPFHTLCEEGGVILLMGVDLDRATIIHYAEQVAGRTPFMRWTRDANGNPAICNIGSCSDGFHHFSDALKPIQKNKIIGNSLWRCFPAKEMVAICAEEMQKNPNISHCQNLDCPRCNDAVLGGPIW